MELKEIYNTKDKRKYADLKEFFNKEIKFIRKDIPDISQNDIRVWLLYAKNEKEKEWICLQVAHSKENAVSEINEDLSFLKEKCDFSNIKEYSDSAFYKNVCPKVDKENYRKYLYSKIGSEYDRFKICFLDVDKYLGIRPNDDKYKKTDAERIIEICKNQYAEAKIAYETLAVYWRFYSSGIDGQTIDYILSNSRNDN